MSGTILEEYNDLSVYKAIEKDIKTNSRFFNQITENEENYNKSQSAKDSIAFAAWFLLHEFMETSSPNEIAKHICDGANDKQIDAVYQDGITLNLIQCKWRTSALGKDDISDIENIWKELKSPSGFEGCNDQLNQFVSLIKRFYQSPACRIRIFLVSPTNLTNGGKEENQDWIDLKEKIEIAGRASHVTIDYYGCEELRQMID